MTTGFQTIAANLLLCAAAYAADQGAVDKEAPWTKTAVQEKDEIERVFRDKIANDMKERERLLKLPYKPETAVRIHILECRISIAEKKHADSLESFFYGTSDAWLKQEERVKDTQGTLMKNFEDRLAIWQQKVDDAERKIAGTCPDPKAPCPAAEELRTVIRAALTKKSEEDAAFRAGREDFDRKRAQLHFLVQSAAANGALWGIVSATAGLHLALAMQSMECEDLARQLSAEDELSRKILGVDLNGLRLEFPPSKSLVAVGGSSR